MKALLEEHIKINNKKLKKKEYNYSQLGLSASEYDISARKTPTKVAIKYLVEVNGETRGDKKVLGKRYADTLKSDFYHREWAVMEETYFNIEEIPLPLNGELKKYTLYRKGKIKAEMKVFNMFADTDTLLGRYRNGSAVSELFYVFDAQSEVDWIFTQSNFDKMIDMRMSCKSISSSSAFSYWESLFVPEGKRGRGYAEILMRYAIEDASIKGVADLDVLFASVWDFEIEEQNRKKQDSLNRYYLNFFKKENVEAELLKNDIIITNVKSE